MLRRNLDFLALMLVLGGMAMIEGVPRLERRILTQAVNYRNEMRGPLVTLPSVFPCPLKAGPMKPIAPPFIVVRDEE